MTVQPLRPGLDPIVLDPQPMEAQTAARELQGSSFSLESAGGWTPSWEGACSCPDDCPRDHPNE